MFLYVRKCRANFILVGKIIKTLKLLAVSFFFLASLYIIIIILLHRGLCRTEIFAIKAAQTNKTLNNIYNTAASRTRANRRVIYWFLRVLFSIFFLFICLVHVCIFIRRVFFVFRKRFYFYKANPKRRSCAGSIICSGVLFLHNDVICFHSTTFRVQI